MRTNVKARHSTRRTAQIAIALLLILSPQLLLAGEFDEDLARVDRALEKNIARVPQEVLQSCLARRDSAVRLYQSGHRDRAARRLNFCVKVLKIPEAKPPAPAVETVSMAEVQARAAREVERALTLTPSLESGLKIYRDCALCHKPEGWGFFNGSVPQIAGQHRKVVIKQLADFRAGNRDNVLMAPYSSVEAIGGAQAVADVAAYVDTLEISVDTGKGRGDDLELGEKVYREHCVRCHGATGQGKNELFIPRIQAQHYRYLVRQFEWIRDGKRRNANPEMVEQIRSFEDRETHAVLDYVSRLEPPAEFQAPPGWRNPDFAE
jgi:cytochrome c553